MTSLLRAALLVSGIVATAASGAAQSPDGGQPVATCRATPTSMTPASWRSPSAARGVSIPAGPLRLARDVALPGPANRFDYQSLDTLAGRLYLNHMNAGTVVIFDLAAGAVRTEVRGTARATGVLAVPAEQAVYVSAAGQHEVVVLDRRSDAIVARIAGARFPDGLAYAPVERKVFVSDESGGAELVIDARTNTRRSLIPLGGEAGNSHYDDVSHCILVAVQTRNELVAIDPAREAIIARYPLPGSDHPHGFALDVPGRRAFVTSEGSATLQVVDLRTMRVVDTQPVGEGPDVLAWDPGWQRLYVAAESGPLHVFDARGPTLRRLETYDAPHAHTVSVDPRTHLVYLPLEQLDGRPVLRILSPAGVATP